MAVVGIKSNNMNSGLQNLSRSLERILEDANLSGELKLSGRKLKDFPKAAGKYNLSDTVIADLSRNRFCELPDDLTSFAFLETLLVYHNALRSIPESVRGLQSLSYLDLRSNQLSVLPREICFLPLEVLLVSNNRLVSLPEELGRMEQLTELDAACNQITHLPVRIGDLGSLRSLSLRNNQLLYLPKELTYLQLVSLDISCNRIATLPVELRLMTSLVDLELVNNPLTSPPASLCVRGLVHVFKYLETSAQKEEKSKSGINFDGNTTLRRQTITPRNTNSLVDGQKNNNRRQNVDSGYSTSDGGLDKRWSDIQGITNESSTSKWSPTPLHVKTEHQNNQKNLLTGGSTTPSISPGANVIYDGNTLEDELKKAILLQENFEKKQNRVAFNVSQTNSTDVSPDGDFDNQKDDRVRPLGNIQTYREYKEALRQQRNNETSSIYRPKDQQTPTDGGTSSTDSPSSNISSSKSQNSSPSPPIYSSNQNSPMSPHRSLLIHKISNLTTTTTTTSTNGQNGHSTTLNTNIFVTSEETSVNSKKPIQKVIPSRNPTYQQTNSINGNHIVEKNGKTTNEFSYVKPCSPIKSTGILNHNNVPPTSGVLKNGGVATPQKNGGSKLVQKPTGRNVSWNRDVPADKLSFTMRREIDKHKEETELIAQLRKIIESRLKMTLPSDIAPALTDGVVLCHLANQVRPRSVASIHVPSPTVPKLTMARCRKNVDNFLEACRKIGVDEEWICSCVDILSSDEETSTILPNPEALLRTIDALLEEERQQLEDNQDEITATNTKTSQNQDYNNYFKNIGIYLPKAAITTETNQQNEYFNNNINYSKDNLIEEIRIVRKIPDTLDLTVKTTTNRKMKPNRNFYVNQKYENLQLNEIIEECEYDSDIGKFNCKVIESSDLNFKINDLNTPKQRPIEFPIGEKLNLNTVGDNKIVMKRIEFFESADKKIVNNFVVEVDKTKNEVINDDKKFSTVLCLTTFLLTVVLLFFYPLPN